MTTPFLQTKLYIPSVRPDPSTDPSTLLRARLVSRPRLIERLNAGLHRKLTLVSAPAGFGKTTLLSEWARPEPVERAAGCGQPVAWVSLGKGDNAPARFLAYFIWLYADSWGAPSGCVTRVPLTTCPSRRDHRRG